MNWKELKDSPPWEWPDDAADMLLVALNDKDAPDADLLLAAELAGDITVINDELAQALLTLVGTSGRSAQLRAQAAISLGPALEAADTGDFDDPESTLLTERAFEQVQASLRHLYSDDQLPAEVRRQVLEASVRAAQDWHQDAIRAAWASDNYPWNLTAVFCMRFVRGFDAQILDALKSAHKAIRYEAVLAAGACGLDAAWPVVSSLVQSPGTDKQLLLAAIDSIAAIRPQEAVPLLERLTEAADEDIADAAVEAMALADGLAEDDGEFDEDEDDELN